MLKAKVAMDLAGNTNASPYWDVVLETTNRSSIAKSLHCSATTTDYSKNPANFAMKLY